MAKQTMNSDENARNDDGSRRWSGKQCCGVAQALEQRRELQHASNKPRPWIERKAMVGAVYAIFVYSWYVYVVRLCIPMIRRDDGALGDRAMGVSFLVVFCLLGLMFLWSYTKLILTPPGFARDYPDQLEKQTSYGNFAQTDGVGGERYEFIPPTAARNTTSGYIADPRSPSISKEYNSNANNASFIPPANADPKLSPLPPAHAPLPNQVQAMSGRATNRNIVMSRIIPREPVLLREHRFCQRDQHVKPIRAHHCRICGTCVLMMDHHCPWVGQCIGAYNYKFFLIFLLWGSLYIPWILGSLIGTVVKGSKTSNFSVDPQFIIIIALSGILSLFCVMMLIMHIGMVLSNVTSIESLGLRDQREDERHFLAQLVPICSTNNAFLERRRIVKDWDREWGRPRSEMNIWWLGSKKANWEYRMGTSKLGWILPIGASGGDGLRFPVNPRFDKEGRYRPRSEWPAELR